MEYTSKTIREIALEAPLTTRIFEELKIDFCCGGRIAFAEACENAGVDPVSVQKKLDQLLEATPVTDNAIESLSISELCDHIVETHHVFTRNELERLSPLMDKVARKHGASHAELYPLQETLKELCDELLVHMRKEEVVLFPYMKELEAAAAANRQPSVPHFGTVKNPVRMMMSEHDAAGDMLRKMREYTSDYMVPEGVCPSFGALYAGLDALEKDLHQHIHLENNLLFPKAVKLEDAIVDQPNPSVCSVGA